MDNHKLWYNLYVFYPVAFEAILNLKKKPVIITLFLDLIGFIVVATI